MCPQSDNEQPTCPICVKNEKADTLPPRDRAVVVDGWRVAHDARSTMRGWMVIAPMRHVESLGELSAAESASLGTVLRNLTQAMVSALGASRSYVLSFTEAVPHLHLHVVPRMPDLQHDRLGPGIIEYQAGPPLDEDTRDDIAGKIRSAWPTD